jgi:hypothetical protein
MDEISQRFKDNLDPLRVLDGHEPFRHSPKMRKFGGLSHTVAALNSLLAAAFVGIIIDSLCAGVIAVISGALIIFGISFRRQMILINKMEKRVKEELKL